MNLSLKRLWEAIHKMLEKKDRLFAEIPAKESFFEESIPNQDKQEQLSLSSKDTQKYQNSRR